MYPMYVREERVMVLHYKPSIQDLIRNDAIDKWYRVDKIVGRKVYAHNTFNPYI